MDRRCPHCGVELRETRDAFCPECRADLAEAPASPGSQGRTGEVSASVVDDLKRPAGVAILAFLHFFGGLVTVAVLVLVAQRGGRGTTARDGNTLPVIVLGTLTFLMVVAFVGGVGLWRGRKWGWFLGAFYYVYSIIGSLSALVLAFVLADKLEDTARGAAYYHTKYLTRIAVHALVLAYLFRNHVLRHFALDPSKKGRALAKLGLAYLLVTAVGLAVGWLL